MTRPTSPVARRMVTAADALADWPAIAEHTHVYDHETAAYVGGHPARILVTEWCVCGVVIQQYFDYRDYE